jgi:hypothetical protein
VVRLELQQTGQSQGGLTLALVNRIRVHGSMQSSRLLWCEGDVSGGGVVSTSGLAPSGTISPDTLVLSPLPVHGRRRVANSKRKTLAVEKVDQENICSVNRNSPRHRVPRSSTVGATAHAEFGLTAPRLHLIPPRTILPNAAHVRYKPALSLEDTRKPFNWVGRAQTPNSIPRSLAPVSEPRPAMHLHILKEDGVGQ